MIGPLATWFRGRTAREQLLLQACAFLLIVGGGLTFGFQTANAYRAEAATDLASAVQLRDDVSRVAALGATAGADAPVASDGTARGAATAVAEQLGLALSSISPDGPTGVRVTFSPASAGAIYAWIDAVERTGFEVTALSLVRAGAGDVVQGDARVSARKP